MSLHDELATPSTCRLCAFLAGLAPSEAAEWRAELALPVTTIGNTAVVNALIRRDVDITEASVRRHRGRHK